MDRNSEVLKHFFMISIYNFTLYWYINVKKIHDTILFVKIRGQTDTCISIFLIPISNFMGILDEKDTIPFWIFCFVTFATAVFYLRTFSLVPNHGYRIFVAHVFHMKIERERGCKWLHPKTTLFTTLARPTKT